MLLLGAIIIPLLLAGSKGEPTVSFDPEELTVVLKETAKAEIIVKEGVSVTDVKVGDKTNLTIATPEKINETWSAIVKGEKVGHEVIKFIVTLDSKGDEEPILLHVTVENSKEWAIFSDVIGWLYFVAWSVSFYPQIYDNWKRKSVVGLNFDFLALNLVGFLMYSLFNAGLYFIDSVKNEYKEIHPTGLIPVMVNDIVFSFHAFLAVIITIIQCFVYERADQAVSLPAKCLIGIGLAFLLASLIASCASALSWLDFLYYCSYVKLAITLIKYIPQAWMNYRRKSTVGWSIGNVLLDFTGGMLSMLQMIVNAWNYNDWDSIFGDPTKFGLGLFSVIFDILFLVQHYFLYRRPYTDFPESVANSRSELVT